MELVVGQMKLNFEVTKVNFQERNIENVFKFNKKTLGYSLYKAKEDKNNRLHKYAEEHLINYSEFIDMKLGRFLFCLKERGCEDYKLYLNKYGDSKFCIYSIDEFQNDKGIYCYIVNNEIKYIGRSKKTFKERFREYGKITPYNCLIDGQSTNCRINSKINKLDSVEVGIYKMTNSSNEEIMAMEKSILQHHSFEWNIQQS